MARRKKPVPAPPPPAPVEEHVLEVELICELTQDEVMAKVPELIQALGTIDEIEAERREHLAEFKARLAEAGARAGRLQHALSARRETRLVTCRDTRDFGAGRFTRVRTDTGETIDDRDLTPSERERMLFNEPDDSGATGIRANCVPSAKAAEA